MPIRLLQFSDIHFGGENSEALSAATDFARAASFDLLVLSGDITQFGHHDEFSAATAWLASAPGPWLSTPGNHDTPWFGLIERALSPFGRYAAAVGPPGATSFAGKGVQVEAINSARGWQVRLNWSKGEVARRQARRVVERLAKAPEDTARVLVCHHPLVEVLGGPMTGRVRGGHYAATRFAEAGVDLILTGHLHAPFLQALPFGDGLTYAVGAGTLSRRERGVPAGFNVIEIEASELTVTAMGWDGRDFAPWRTWAAPLRPRLGSAPLAVEAAQLTRAAS